MTKNILFFDFDGTLRLEKTDEITDATYQCFETLKKQGDLLFLNTGRSYQALDDLVFTLPFDGFICGCGTYIRYHDEILLEAKLPQQHMKEVLNCLDKYHIDAYFEGHHGLYYHQVHSSYMKEQIESIERRGLSFLDTSDPSFHFVKMSVHYPNEEARKAFEEEMCPYFDFICHSEDETEVILKGHSKGIALETVLAYFNIEKENSYAFGDSNNDEEMLLKAGHSILIGEKAKHLVPKVSFVSKDVEHDGVAYALKKLNLIRGND